MKKGSFYLYACIVIFSLTSCNDYLDIVPDRTQEVSLLFEREEAAYTALATCYSYLPQNDGLYASYALASDEITTPFAKEPNALKLMKGDQDADDPLMGFWSGYGASGRGQGSLWDGIRSCNLLIDNIDQVIDMEQEEKNSWKAEAQLLKAYYHFLLASNYGPIPIVDNNLSIDASDEELRVHRKSVDEVFAYIMQTIDNAITDLPQRVSSKNDLGRMDKVIAHAIKSKVAVYAASPLFNGNSAFYIDFVNHDGTPFFNPNYDVTKWELAANVSREALDFTTGQGVSMYNFTDNPPTFDESNINSEFYQTLYDLKFSITDKWNSELLWGDSNPVNSWWRIQAGALVKDPTASSVEASWQWISPTLRMAELFYSRNGLPIDEDLSYNYNGRYDIATVPGDRKNYALPGLKTAYLHLDREPRFYSSIGFDTGQYRAWGQLWTLRMRKGQTHGRIAQTSDYLISGYALKKLVHPDSEGDGYDKLVRYPWPNARLAELYLNYAEAMNEAYGPSKEVYDAVNTVRRRAGIPELETAWGNASIAKTPNKHTTKEGLREIIQHERMIELAFEGHRYNDIRRWKLAETYFNTAVYGWSVDETTEVGFYQVKQVGERSFLSPRDYLQPIKTSELTTNPNLIQNPGW
jgi:hypothetical protein